MARAPGARLLAVVAVLAALIAGGWASSAEDPRVSICEALPAHAAVSSRAASSLLRKHAHPPIRPTQQPHTKQLAELRALRAKARDRVIVLSSEQFERYASMAPPVGKKGKSSAAPTPAPTPTPKERPYALAVFMSAKHMMDSPKTRLRDLRFEYALAAKAFADAPSPSSSSDDSSGSAADDADAAPASAPQSRDVFFAELWHHSSKDLFGRLGVKALPMVFVLSPTHPGPSSSSGQIKIPEADEMGRDGQAASGFTKYPWAAEEMVAWMLGRVAGSRASQVERPSFVRSPMFPLAFAGLLTTGAAAAWRLYGSRLARKPAVWGAGALGVWWFSVSGGMFNIIRGMPLVGIDPRQPGRVAWWSSSRTVQYGMEGFVMGSSYLLFSVLLGSAVFSVPKIKSPATRSSAGLAVLAMAWLVLMRILAAYDSKTSLGRQRQFIGFI
jgi:oligosaccharyltransferase complex subunit gamma